MPTILQIFEQNNNVSGKLLLQTDVAKKCYFIPWVRLKKKYYGKIIWIGEYRWWGNNHRSLNIKRVADSEKYRLIKKIPILPKNHPIRKKLEMYVKIENGTKTNAKS